MPRNPPAILGGLAALMVSMLVSLAWQPSPKWPDPSVPTPHDAWATQARIDQIRQRLQHDRARADEAVAHYRPANSTTISDVSTPAAEVLRGLPFVQRVEVSPSTGPVSKRIVHLLDARLRSRELFFLDVHVGRPGGPTVAEADLLYQEHLLQVELVQVRQAAVLRCLVRQHGLEAVVIEDLTGADDREFQRRLAAAREAEAQQPALRQQLAEAQVLLRHIAATEDHGSQRYYKVQAAAREVAYALDQHRLQLLEMGAAARLVVSGELTTLLRLGQGAAGDGSSSSHGGDSPGRDRLQLLGRKGGLIGNALAAAPALVIVASGCRDLTASLPREAGCVYVRVTVQAYRDVQG